MGFAPMHAHHKSKPSPHHPRSQILSSRASSNCTTGGFYHSPSASSTAPSNSPLLISWDTTCLSSTKVDIHLIAPSYSGGSNEAASWTGINNADGQKSVTLNPAWWNNTASFQLQLVIVQAGLPTAMATLPAGPVFTVTNNGTSSSASSSSSSSSSSSGDSTTGTIGNTGTSKSLSGGKTAAAVIFPLLAVGVALFFYIRHHRRKSNIKSQRFSQALDKRMSTISTDWKSMSAAGAQAAIRSSMAVGDRQSKAFSFGNIRPSMDWEDGKYMADDDNEKMMEPMPQMTQVRTGTGVGLRNPKAAAAIAAERASRVSRVSFADTVGTRPSMESRRTRLGVASTYENVPPVPIRKDVLSTAGSVYPDSEVEKRVVEEEEGEEERSEESTPAMSPRQRTGALTLTQEDISMRISPVQQQEKEYKTSFDEVMPALTLMRTGSTSRSSPNTNSNINDPDDYLLPQLPPPTHSPASALPSVLPLSPNTPTSAFTLSAYTTQPNSAMPPPEMMPVMSPDDMLRAYAVRRKSNQAQYSSQAPPSSSAAAIAASSSPGIGGSPKGKGRKLSFRASFGLKKKDRDDRVGSPSPMMLKISEPMPIPGSPVAHSPYSPGGEFGMAGVGARGMGMAGVGAGAGAGVGAHGYGQAYGQQQQHAPVQYVVGEDDGDEEYEYGDVDAYGGVGAAHAH
ncbi:hypothetical protein H0H93_011066 [Arthromyces matolae]|nr:hypothetical protein H0H93_011066 [Arthromyces matolae]